MKKIIFKILWFVIDKWFYDEATEEITDRFTYEHNLREWYKARRAGYKRSEMGWYYAEQQEKY